MRKIALALFFALPPCVSSSPVVRPLRTHEIAIGPYHERSVESFVGSLMYEGGCLVFDGENGSARLLPIWPGGTRFEESLVTFHRPAKDDQRFAVNQEIRIDGVPTDWAQLDPAAFGPFQHQCGWAQPFFVSGAAPAN